MSLIDRIRNLFAGRSEAVAEPDPALTPLMRSRSLISPSIPTTETETGPSSIKVQMEAWLFDERTDYPTEVVGEAYRTSEVARVRRSIAPTNQEYVFTAVLVPEPDNTHDSNAVAVYASPYGHVGYIKRSQARRWGPLIQDFNRITNQAVACKGIIRGERTFEIFLNVKITDIQDELDRCKVAPRVPPSSEGGA